MKKTVLSILLLFGFAFGAFADEMIPASSLISEVDNNQLRFDNNYTGKTITTEGFVGAINEVNGEYTLQLLGDQRAMTPLSIQCIFDTSHKGTLLELNKGDAVQLSGKYKGKQQSQIGIIVLFECEILSKSSAPSRADQTAASDIVATLRGLKAACAMFYADNMDDINNGKITTSDINAKGSPQKYLAKYMDNPRAIGDQYIFITGTISGGEHWFIGEHVADKPQGVKESLKERAKRTGLYRNANFISRNGEDDLYDGGDIVYMVAR